ncbi:MAG: UDP-forming cellulose synthase catalytic subunit [Nevskiaceae bacterium]|nr:MAG: UDP-forming cellulose synthase catalytic subunit [Nevskiaceae bacterium]
MSLPLLLAWLARELGVENPRRLRLWLLRLFVLPPAQARPWPAWMQRLARRYLPWLAVQLGVIHPESPGEWLLRLFVLPPANAQPASRNWLTRLLRTVLGRAYGPTRAAARWLGTPLRLAYARYQRIDFQHAGRRLETVAIRSFDVPPLLRAAIIAAAAVSFWLAATTPLNWGEQFAFMLLMWLTALIIRRMPGNLPTLVLTTLSLVATARYGWWRVTQTMNLETPVEYVFGFGLLAAEAYTWLIMLLGYFQNAWPLRRKPVPLPDDPALWPTVDIYIPTYNEPLKVVKATVFAARGLDWPQEKLNVYLLDDGRREEFRNFAAEAGVQYVTRSNNAHAKAGNLNHALKVTRGEFIAIFDCDHIPVRSFLQTNMGWFLRDPKCAMLQTPHHFFSPDPFERNLGTFRRVPNEGKLFYGLVQDGNDLWNATFFCGSCAIIKRAPLEQIGGIAVETVTEDAHTALKLHRLGYNTAYINVIQAAGLATESLSGHIGQRIRWARGMVQIFRSDNPLFGKGLKLYQRLCYSNAMLHFLNGLPRLAFLTAPLTYLYFQLHIINAGAWMLGIYVLPHLIHSTLANSRMQGRYRHSFWAEVYESVLAWYITLPTTIALINPRLGKFNVTAKGGLIQREYFDWYISKPYMALVLLNFGGLAIGIMRLFYWNTFEQATVMMNLLWTFNNLVMLGTAMAVASEARQTRVSHRVPMRMPATLYLSDGRTLHCITRNYSTGGLDLRIGRQDALPDDNRVHVSLSRGDRSFSFAARIVSRRSNGLGIRFENLSLEDEMRLIQCTFGRADAWLEWDDDSARDRPLRSLVEVLAYGFRGYARMFGNLADAVAARMVEQRGLQRSPGN